MIKIAIIEDNQEYRESFKEFFTRTSTSFECVFAVDSIEKFIKYYHHNLELEFILVDINLPGMSGIKGVNHIQRLKIDTEIIMLTSLNDSKSIFQALTSGATGYLLKNLTFEEIEKQLLKVIDQGAAMSPEVARRLIKHFHPKKSSLFIDSKNELSTKEKQIIQFVIDGKTYEEIAPILGLTINGLKYHIKSIYKKTHVKSKGGIIKKFFNQNFSI
ncbi:MAG: response regulator [Saprospiraceae bacterium]